MSCFICQKHAGQIAPPPGGYIFEDLHWKVCHAPISHGPLGTLVVESKRHFLDFADLLPAEAASYGPLLQRLYAALKPLVPAERLYHLLFVEGESHFHAWLVPRRASDDERGRAFLAKDLVCDEADAQQLAQTLRELLARPTE